MTGCNASAAREASEQPVGTLCPACGAAGDTGGDELCPWCGLDLRGPKPRSCANWPSSSTASTASSGRLGERRQPGRGRAGNRRWTPQQGCTRTRPASSPTGWRPAHVPPAGQAEWSVDRVRSVLLWVGAALLTISALTFTTVAWAHLGNGGRAAAPRRGHGLVRRWRGSRCAAACRDRGGVHRAVDRAGRDRLAGAPARRADRRHVGHGVVDDRLAARLGVGVRPRNRGRPAHARGPRSRCCCRSPSSSRSPRSPARAGVAALDSRSSRVLPRSCGAGCAAYSVAVRCGRALMAYTLTTWFARRDLRRGRTFQADTFAAGARTGDRSVDAHARAAGTDACATQTPSDFDRVLATLVCAVGRRGVRRRGIQELRPARDAGVGDVVASAAFVLAPSLPPPLDPAGHVTGYGFGVAGLTSGVVASLTAILGPTAWLSHAWQGSLDAAARDVFAARTRRRRGSFGWPAVAALWRCAVTIALGGARAIRGRQALVSAREGARCGHGDWSRVRGVPRPRRRGRIGRASTCATTMTATRC